MTSREVLTNYEEQIDRWVGGESLHVKYRKIAEDCCPDFSCCNPKLLQPVEVRRAFKAASRRERTKLRMVFLGLGVLGEHQGAHHRRRHMMFSVRIDKDGEGYVFKVQPAEGTLVEMVALDSAPGVMAMVRATNEGHACHVAWEKALRMRDERPKQFDGGDELIELLQRTLGRSK